MPVKIRFIDIKCHVPEDDVPPFDHPYLKWKNGPKIWGPVRMGAGHGATINSTWDMPGEVGEVELWEDDDVDPDDHLGTRVVRVSELGDGPKQAPFNEDGARYTLVYEVIN